MLIRAAVIGFMLLLLLFLAWRILRGSKPKHLFEVRVGDAPDRVDIEGSVPGFDSAAVRARVAELELPRGARFQGAPSPGEPGFRLLFSKDISERTRAALREYLYRFDDSRPATDGDAAEGPGETPALAWLADGRVHLCPAGGQAKGIDSRFGQELRERAVRIERRHDWKRKGRSAQFQGMLWGMYDPDPAAFPIRVTSISGGRTEGELLYALSTPEIAGIFAVEAASEAEQRLFHSAELWVGDLAVRPGEERIACSVDKPSGIANLAVVRSDGSELSEITEGDSIDCAPRWVSGVPETLVFQSAGIGRDEEGLHIDRSPFAIEQLNVRSGHMFRLLEEPGHDLLTPALDAEGTLTFIRRPHQKTPRAPASRVIVDALLMPFRLIYALFQWLNFFTVRHTGRPLSTSGQPAKDGADMKRLMLYGNVIEAERLQKEAAARGDRGAGLVPRSWQLVRRSPDGVETILARGVLAFDVCPDGALVYTNGTSIYHLPPGGTPRKLADGTYVERVAVVG